MRTVHVLVFFAFTSVTHAIIFEGTTFEEDHVCELKTGSQGVCQLPGLCPTGGANQESLPDCKIEGVAHLCCPPATVTRPSQSKSRQKCKELSQLANITGNCPESRPFLGSNEAVPREFPHMAAVGSQKNSSDQIQWRCGGSLVSKRYVLTAATCAVDPPTIMPVKWVRLGDINLQSDSDDVHAQTVSVEKVIVHPKFQSPNQDHDIALLKLSSDVRLSEFVRPACLHAEDTTPASRAVVAGWGSTDWTSFSGSSTLRKVDLSLISAEKCAELFKPLTGQKRIPVGIDYTKMICAGESSGGKDTCKGDSGSPLQWKLAHPYCTYSIVGITSFGMFTCGMVDSVTVFTRVSHYVSWIDNIVWAQD